MREKILEFGGAMGGAVKKVLGEFLENLLIWKAFFVAGSTGLEPATSGVTGQRSDQLNYDPVTEGSFFHWEWWALQGSNL